MTALLINKMFLLEHNAVEATNITWAKVASNSVTIGGGGWASISSKKMKFL